MKNVLQFLETSANKLPQKQAFVCSDTSCTYSQMLEKSKKLGSALTKITKPNKPIAVLMEKGCDTLATFFGIVYSGCCYVLMNPALPLDRLKKIKEILQAECVITDSEHFELAKEIFEDNTNAVHLSNELMDSEIDDSALSLIRQNMIDTDALYINFTSGSTGVPKGVIINHRSVIDFISIFTKTFDITENDVIANQAPFDFDVSVKDIYSAISTGAQLVLVPKNLFSEPTQLLDYLCDNNITVMIWAVSALCLITTFHALDYKTPKTVKKILFSGEVMPAKHLSQWLEKLPDTTFVNLYGPTEITCNCTYHIVDRNAENAVLPIGKAFDNERVLLLDENNKQITQKGQTGEICVSGTCLSFGYFNSPEQTAKAFVQNPLNPYYPEIIYRTGDLGYYDENGNIFFSGRKDFQIKHMGHRIELEEIEKAIHDIDGIARCCCIFDENKSKLYGFYIGDYEKRELYQILKEKLPEFMIPGALRKVENLPLTKNGKIDRKALKESVVKK
ncbi:MAG: amino acid adenylation domain-containing protein [Clostridiales bacterium]|nr:amino acid adenylation domain-containing protein [Clostridiales bacterium]